MAEVVGARATLECRWVVCENSRTWLSNGAPIFIACSLKFLFLVLLGAPDYLSILSIPSTIQIDPYRKWNYKTNQTKSWSWGKNRNQDKHNRYHIESCIFGRITHFLDLFKWVWGMHNFITNSTNWNTAHLSTLINTATLYNISLANKGVTATTFRTS